MVLSDDGARGHLGVEIVGSGARFEVGADERGDGRLLRLADQVRDDDQQVARYDGQLDRAPRRDL